MLFRTLLSLTLFLLLLSTGIVVATETLAPGDKLPETRLCDQHGEPHNLTKARLILFAPDKAAGELIHEVLRDKTQTELDRQGIVVISDISRMPGLITRFIALPAMRDYSYRMLLGQDEEETQWLPRQEGAVTQLIVQNGQIRELDYLPSAEELKRLMAPNNADRL